MRRLHDPSVAGKQEGGQARIVAWILGWGLEVWQGLWVHGFSCTGKLKGNSILCVLG